MKNKLLLIASGLVLSAAAAFAADKADYEKALAAAKDAIATAAAAKGEWRDTGKILSAAEEAAKAGDYDKAVTLTEEARMQGILGAQQANEQANVGNPDYLYR